MSKSREEKLINALNWKDGGDGFWWIFYDDIPEDCRDHVEEVWMAEYACDDKAGKGWFLETRTDDFFKTDFLVRHLIRQRVRELLDELGLCYYHHRIPGEGNKIVIELENDESPVFETGWFSDEELPEKKQDLLLWLAEERGGK